MGTCRASGDLNSKCSLLWGSVMESRLASYDGAKVQVCINALKRSRSLGSQNKAGLKPIVLYPAVYILAAIMLILIMQDDGCCPRALY